MMRERMKDADSKFCKKVSEQSPTKIGFVLGAITNLPLLAIVLGGFGV
ncbi:hypothetical protein [Planococcus sp. S3-L1]|nr:hypothetical protein [Planococcus sp. S3-L1]MDJ0332118.1 hypothetical protein [Planococcus sp. S3-L1]